MALIGKSNLRTSRYYAVVIALAGNILEGVFCALMIGVWFLAFVGAFHLSLTFRGKKFLLRSFLTKLAASVAVCFAILFLLFESKMLRAADTFAIVVYVLGSINLLYVSYHNPSSAKPNPPITVTTPDK